MINTESTKAARASVLKLQRVLEGGGLPLSLDQRLPVMSVEEQKQALRDGVGRNKAMWRLKDIGAFVDAEILRQDNGGSLITRRALKMADQAVTAAEVLEKATGVVENQLAKFNVVADNAIAEAKKRVTQLTDYNNRLAVALNNLNKTLGDERMLRALENADKMVSALELLDQLEKSGSLEKIMAAMRP